MNFAIKISSSPYHSQASDTAYHFIDAALQKGYGIYRVFFYGDGIYNALRYANPPADEREIVKRWSLLAREFDLDLVVCVSAAQRRGLLSEEENRLLGRRDSDLAEGFRISGLGQWAEAMLEADRVLVFSG